MSILKIVIKKGHKSSALGLFGIILVVFASIGIIANFINLNIEQTNKVSFKSAGVQYRKHFTTVELMSLQDKSIEEKQTPRKYERKVLKKVLVNGTDYFMSVKESKSTNSSLKRVVKQPVVLEKMEINSDLQVLSSFDCVKSIPTVLLNYISNMFINEYGKSHKDFHLQQKIDETLPLLKEFSINCGSDQNCSTVFKYDKQYGINTTADKTYQREHVFYCCPSVHSLTNETVSDVCKRAQSVVWRSAFRESKESMFLGRVNELSTHTYSGVLVILHLGYFAGCSLSCNFIGI